MTPIRITKVNDTYMKVTCSEVYQELDISDRFTFEIPNAKHDPRYKKGFWDGKKKLYNRNNKRMYVGLLHHLVEFLAGKGWKFDIDPALMPSSDPMSDDDVRALVSEVIEPQSNGDPIEPYDYQIEAVKHMLNMDRSVILAATSAGKSLIIYLAARIYQLMDELEGRTIFITVPNVSLVEQLYNDFKDYSDGTDWHVTQHCQKISGKYGKFVTNQIVITTWQSMVKLPTDVIDAAGAVIVDEAHTASAKVLGGLVEGLHSCPFRHGLTGTLDRMECNELVVQGLLGPSRRIITARELIDQGRAANIEVLMTMIDHSRQTIDEYQTFLGKTKGTARYQKEIEFLNNLAPRRDLINGIISSLEGNTLVLFDRVDEYGKQMYEAYSENHPDTFLYVGEIDSTLRETIRQQMEDHENATIFASVGTMSTGVSIKKLHNLVVISSSKSPIRTLQSIGRMMRLHSSKGTAKIIDIVDNLSDQGSPNYVLNHAQTRLGYYTEESFDVNFISLDL